MELKNAWRREFAARVDENKEAQCVELGCLSPPQCSRDNESDSADPAGEKEKAVSLREGPFTRLLSENLQRNKSRFQRLSEYTHVGYATQRSQIITLTLPVIITHNQIHRAQIRKKK